MRIASVCAEPRSSFQQRRRSSILQAALTARAGSSSCTLGTPNTAMIASPTNFSIVPPSDSISAAMAAK